MASQAPFRYQIPLDSVISLHLKLLHQHLRLKGGSTDVHRLTRGVLELSELLERFYMVSQAQSPLLSTSSIHVVHVIHVTHVRLSNIN